MSALSVRSLIGRWNCHNCYATFKVAWQILSWHEDCASEVVCRDRCDGERKEKPIFNSRGCHKKRLGV